jgi:hypothetical protein
MGIQGKERIALYVRASNWQNDFNTIGMALIVISSVVNYVLTGMVLSCLVQFC